MSRSNSSIGRTSSDYHEFESRVVEFVRSLYPQQAADGLLVSLVVAVIAEHANLPTQMPMLESLLCEMYGHPCNVYTELPDKVAASVISYGKLMPTSTMLIRLLVANDPDLQESVDFFALPKPECDGMFRLVGIAYTFDNLKALLRGTDTFTGQMHQIQQAEKFPVDIKEYKSRTLPLSIMQIYAALSDPILCTDVFVFEDTHHLVMYECILA